jgi:hypothetical protein
MDCSILELADDGKITRLSQWAPVLDTTSLQLRNQWILSTCAAVEYESSDSCGYLTLLSVVDGWIVISVVSSKRGEGIKPITPDDIAGALSCCWEGYCKANRACDGVAMQQVFHPLCRLTYSNQEKVTIINSVEFCKMVTNRYSMEQHAPFRKWKDEPEVSSRDTLLGASFIAPQLGVVQLKVGHPPFLWTDLLVCAKMDDRWWIVAKSSSSEPFVPVVDHTPLIVHDSNKIDLNTI